MKKIILLLIIASLILSEVNCLWNYLGANEEKRIVKAYY